MDLNIRVKADAADAVNELKRVAAEVNAAKATAARGRAVAGAGPQLGQGVQAEQSEKVEDAKTYLQQTRALVNRLGSFALKAGALGAAFSYTGKANELLAKAGAINDMAERLGISAEALQELEYAAEASGAGIRDLEAAFKAIGLRSVEAVGGNRELLEIFERFNITTDMLKTKSPEELFRQIAKEAEKLPRSAQLLSDLTKVIGSGADNLLPAFQNGFSAAADEARNAGAIIDEEIVRTLDEASDRVELIAKRMTAMLAPAIAVAADNMSTFMARLHTSLTFATSLAGALTVRGVGFGEALQQAVNEASKVQESLAMKERAKSTDRTITSEISREVQKAAAATQTMSYFRPADQLARIGLYRGGQDPVANIAKSQLNRLGAIHSELQGIKAELASEF